MQDGPGGKPARGHRMVLCHDEVIGQRYVPNQRARIPFEDGGYLVETNSLGFRSNREFTAARTRRRRILFLGDSYTAGYGVDNDERFAELAGGLLDCEVYNAGVTGTGTDQQVLAYEAYLSDIECDLVVLGVWIENIERIKAEVHVTIDPRSGDRVATAKPFFVLDGRGELRLENSPVPRARRSAEHLDLYGRVEPSGRRHRVRSLVVDVLRSEKLDRLGRRAADNVRHRIQRATGQQVYPDYGDADSRGWQLMEAIIGRLARALDGTPLLIMPIPTGHYFRDSPLRPLYQQRFETLADPDRRIHVADISTPIAALPAPTRAQLTFRTDAHFSRAGHRAVAECVADAIAELDGFARVELDGGHRDENDLRVPARGS